MGAGSSLISQELGSFAGTITFDALVKVLAAGAEQQVSAQVPAPVVIGWGRKDRLCLPQQANRAMAAYPDARVHWFQSSGHFPMWDQPQETVRVILDAADRS
jgi:pimeloyl-ACP methyl ester carboxylesterase